jgi:branched-chain amino acid transport system ATP-binding protein
LGLLEIQNVTKDFGGLVALRDVSFDIGPGEVVGLIGPNGAGKSTLFNVVTGIERPSAGKVLFEGRNIVGLRPHEVARLGISRTFQSVRPFLSYTVEENLKVGAFFGRRDVGRPSERIKRALELTGLEQTRDQLVSTLPIERRKLVEVARALASSPKLLLLDEPMAGLNPSEVKVFIDLVRRVNREGVSVLVVEHLMRAITDISSRVVVLNAGMKIAEGKPEDVLKIEHVVGVYLGKEYAGA